MSSGEFWLRAGFSAPRDPGGGQRRAVCRPADGSLAEAERSTGLIAKMDYALKRFLWL